MSLLAQAAKANITPVDQSIFALTDLGKVFNNLIRLGLFLAGIIVFVFLIIGGIQWITSGGDKAKTEAARGRITAAVVGLAIVASSFAIMSVLGTLFGINIWDPSAVFQNLNR